MSHMEVINIRFFDQNIEQIVSRYITPVLRQDSVKENWDIKIMRHYRLHMEIAIMLVSKHQTDGLKKSVLGLQLVENLKFLGIINHSVWNELSV